MPWVWPSILLFLSAPQTPYRVAVPGYHFVFPRDNFNHPDFQTEWWYYMGNLRSSDGRPFGFELTFFREGVARDAVQTSPWDVEDVYLAHLALSDIAGRQYLSTERLNRAGPGLAGADLERSRIWNGNWSIEWHGDTQSLRAVADRFTLELALKSAKPPVINGVDGVSQKSEGAGHASYYISLTRLVTSGEITLDGETYKVQGLSWMDHEFFSQLLDKDQVGWDWFSFEFNDGTELMLYELRRSDGTVDPYSAGTYVDASGHARHLRVTDFQLDPGRTWTSPATHATYPIAWRVEVPSLSLRLETTTPLEPQEFVSGSRFAPTYWEGAIRAKGIKLGSPIEGEGYLEMTGYDRAVRTSE
ncbi:MAG TPA: lipocalin-like domain-containing protein [Terriglobia bacterium]|nr:lipocalin-like domain-containing protein [Terriglobia bacterium]